MKKLSFVLICITCFSLLFNSCKKNTINGKQPEEFIGEPVDLTSKTTASVSGFVTNENDEPVEAANVQYGSFFAVTDEFGYFEIRDAIVSRQAAFVTVNRTGYFKGIKTFIIQDGHPNFCRIKLIPKTNSGTIDANAGGAVVLQNGLNVSLPAAAVVNKADNSIYTGVINVSSYWINPEDEDLGKIMPGDLRGMDNNGVMNGLTTYGMAAVELTGSSGELLQIASGKKAAVSFPLSSVLLAHAPVSIPLWYFDESIGLWKEEGVAVKSGNFYTGEVSHFSFWNCDVPNSIMTSFQCTLVDSSDQPMAGMNVRVSVADSYGDNGSGYSDENGYVYGMIPRNRNLLLEVIAQGCTVFSLPFTSSVSSGVSLGKIIIPTSHIGTISGTVYNCNNAIVTYGNIISKLHNEYSKYRLNNDGTFSVRQIICGSTENVLLIAEDLDTHKQSVPVSLNITAGFISHNLQACDISSQEFIVYSLNGTTTSLNQSMVTFTHDYSINSPNIYHFTGTHPSFAWIHFGIVSTNISLNSEQLLSYINPSQLSGTATPASPIHVRITEYGQIGQFIGGYFSGLVHDPVANINYNMECTFRIRRAY